MTGPAFPDVPVPPPGTAAFYIRESELPGGRWRTRCVLGDAWPDGELLVDPVDTDGMFVLWRTDVDDDGHGRIDHNPAAHDLAPPLWFVLLPETDLDRPAMSLVGFATDHHPVGRIITDAEFFTTPVRSAEQVGAIRWWHLEGVIDQVFVATDWRRQGVATKLIYSVNACQALHGHPVDIRSDGRRTELGHHLDAGTRFPGRFAPITEVSPPMDPPPDGI